MDIIKKNLAEAHENIGKFLDNEKNIGRIKRAGDIMTKAIMNNKKIIACGNGGSMCDAMHFAEELTGKFREDRKSLPSIAISDPSYISCAANDFGYSDVFSRFVDGIGNDGDVLLAISTSGNSPNVIHAIQQAKKKGMRAIGLSGKTGGRMAELCDVEIRAPETEYSDRAQEIHGIIIHILIDYIERHLLLNIND